MSCLCTDTRGRLQQSTVHTSPCPAALHHVPSPCTAVAQCRSCLSCCRYCLAAVGLLTRQSFLVSLVLNYLVLHVCSYGGNHHSLHNQTCDDSSKMRNTNKEKLLPVGHMCCPAVCRDQNCVPPQVKILSQRQASGIWAKAIRRITVQGCTQPLDGRTVNSQHTQWRASPIHTESGKRNSYPTAHQFSCSFCI